MFFRLAPLLFFSCLAIASSSIIPPTEIQVKNPHGIKASVQVTMWSRKVYRQSYKKIGETAVDINGRAHFDSQRVKKFGWYALSFTWTPNGLPERRITYEIRMKQGKRVKGGRAIKASTQKSFYQTEDLGGGDCGSLFNYEIRDGILHVEFSMPETYSACEKSGRAIADVASIGQRNINDGKYNYYKFGDDQRMGLDFYNQLSKSDDNPPLKDARVTSYVRNLVNRIGKASDMPDLEYNVTVIDADVLNAFAVPGGYLWVYRGLIENTETEAELVGVLAHEIAHITSRHGTEGMTSTINKMVLGTVLGEVAASQTKDDKTAALVQNILAGGTQAWIIGGTRKAEAEADRLGAQYAWRAGYDPDGMATLFQRWSTKKGNQTRLDEFFSDHPNDLTRVANVRRDIGYFLPTGKKLITSSRAYTDIKRRLAKMRPPKVRGEAAGQALFSTFASLNERVLTNEIGAYMAAEEKKAEKAQEQQQQ